MPKKTHRTLVACISLEMGLNPSIPAYAGGLGVLAGERSVQRATCSSMPCYG